MNLSQLYRVGFCIAAFLFVLALLQHFFLPGSEGKLVMQLQRFSSVLESMLELFAVSSVCRVTIGIYGVTNVAVPTDFLFVYKLLFCSTRYTIQIDYYVILCTQGLRGELRTF